MRRSLRIEELAGESKVIFVCERRSGEIVKLSYLMSMVCPEAVDAYTHPSARRTGNSVLNRFLSDFEHPNENVGVPAANYGPLRCV